MKSATTAALVLSLGAFLGATGELRAQKPGALEARIITQADVERIERTLAHDTMQGRQVGTPGAAKASEFIAAEMKRIGLKPAGDNGTYFQSVAGTVQNYVAQASMGVDATPLVFNTDYTVVPGAVAPQPIEKAQVIFGGVANDTVNTITADQAAGKVVVLLPAPIPAGGRGGRGGVPAKFAKAAAIFTVSLDGLDARSIQMISNPMRATSPRAAPANAPPPAAAPVTNPPAQIRITSAALTKLFGGNTQLTPGMKGGTVSGKFDYRSTPQPTWTRNVIGIIPGTDPKLKDEWILIDAHYDHLGMRLPAVNGDSVYNGADDDASGTVAVLEIARAIKAGAAPKRSMIFAAMTGEESGLVGTGYYLANPVVPMNKLVANMEIEMIGRPDSLSDGKGGAWLTGYERSDMGEMFAAAGIRVFPDKRPTQNFFSRSDNRAFACAGVPAHTFSTFNLHKDYHQLSDDVNTIDFEHMTQVIQAGARGARILADGPAPHWKPNGTPVGTPVCGR